MHVSNGFDHPVLQQVAHLGAAQLAYRAQAEVGAGRRRGGSASFMRILRPVALERALGQYAAVEPPGRV